MDFTPWMPGGVLVILGLAIALGVPRSERWAIALGLADAALGVAWITYDWIAKT